MGVPKIYRGLPEVNLASYDFYDLSTGTGYKNFYGADVITGTDTTTYVITTQTPYSDIGYTNVYQTTTDIDFNITFEVPFILEGDCIFTLPVGSASNISVAVTITLYKVDTNNAETQIGTSVIKTIVVNNTSKIFTGKYTIPLINFKAGEKLRFNISAGSPGSTKYITYFHDPKNRDGTTLGNPVSPGTVPATTQLILNLPIKL